MSERTGLPGGEVITDIKRCVSIATDWIVRYIKSYLYYTLCYCGAGLTSRYSSRFTNIKNLTAIQVVRNAIGGGGYTDRRRCY